GAGMPGPPLCGSTGTIPVPATDRILSLAGSGSELEENGKSSSKKLDTMTLIKEDMDIFGHCPAHDEFYLVVCNHCSQVVKPQAFQKHCGEPGNCRDGCSTPWCWQQRRQCQRGWLWGREGAHSWASPGPVPGRTPGAAKALQEKHPGARGRAQPLPEHTDKDSNLCLFVPVVNLEKIPSIPKPDGHGIKVPPKAVPTNSKESLGKPAAAAVPREPPVPAGVGGDSAMPESIPAPGEKDVGAPKAPPRSHRKLARESPAPFPCRPWEGGADDPGGTSWGRNSGGQVWQWGRYRGSGSSRSSPAGWEVPALPPSSGHPAGLGAAPKEWPQLRMDPQIRITPTLPLCRRARLSSDSDPEDAPATSGEGSVGGFPLPLPKGGSRVSSEDSEEEG
ncbi:AT7L2 protein, partial [Rhadina sibilatrix]|nr:AT7L2 protein [Rhadina sibilatrix]